MSIKSTTGNVAISTTPTVNTKVKLSMRSKLAYGLMDGGGGLIYSYVILFVMFFATDVYGVNAAVMGTVLLISRLWDAINDPIIGGLADRTRSRWGVYRPWILFSSIPMVILTILLFTSMPFPTEMGRTIYMVVVFLLFVTAFTCVNIPYSAMTASLTQDTDERAKLTTYRQIFANSFGLFIAGLGTLTFVGLLGQGNMEKGFLWTTIIFGIITIVVYVVGFLGTKEVVVPPVQKQTFKEMFHSMKGNKPAWIVAIGFFVLGVFLYGRATVYMYYFTYNAGNSNLMTTFMLFLGIGAIIGIALVPKINSMVSNKSFLIRGGFIIGGILMVVTYFVDPISNWTLFIILNVIIAALIYGGTATIYGMIPDTVEYGEHKTGTRAAGFISSFVNFIMKLGMTIGMASVGFLLAIFGYQAGVSQPESVLNGINMIMNLFPGILCILSGLVFFAYKLDRKTYYELFNEIEARSHKS
ncbi:hypothetical protein BTR23_10700 [Alkalihalophilus pseudofirmus]|nr:hypothetical protein BTR23_10700 [Alkalihalophilus pseudofirmus]